MWTYHGCYLYHIDLSFAITWLLPIFKFLDYVGPCKSLKLHIKASLISFNSGCSWCSGNNLELIDNNIFSVSL